MSGPTSAIERLSSWVKRHPRITGAGALMVALATVSRLPTPRSASPEAPAPVVAKRHPTLPVDVPAMFGERFVGPTLKDAGSAQYRNLTYRVRLGVPTLCGEVNARNSFGGYTGFRRFMVMGSVLTFNSVPRAAKVWRQTWVRFCEHSDKDDPKHRAADRSPS